MAKAKKAISVVERRVQSGSIFRAGSRPIPLKEVDRWELREVNSAISDQHLYEMQADKQWTYLAVEDLDVKPEDIGYRVLDGRLVKGQQGHIVLMKMEKSDYKAVQKAKEAENRRQTFGKKAVRQSILSQAAGAEGVGDEGADFLARNLNKIQVTDSLERVSLDE